MKFFIFFLLLAPTCVSSQQRHLVSPTGQMYPLKSGENASDALRRLGAAAGCDTLPASTTQAGYDDTQYPTNTFLSVHHKDVVGQWYIAPAPGTIDTIFWLNSGSVGAKDSLVEVRINRSNIFPGQGPGFGPYPAPCQQWGYYRSAFDLDRGVTPFHNEATDTSWVSTLFFGPPTFDPLGADLWVGNGYPVVAHSNGVNFLSLDEFGEKPHVNAGDPFFITFRVNSANAHSYPPDGPTDFAMSEFQVPLSDANYPARNWVFFEHDSAMVYCGYLPGMALQRGWTAVGNTSIDSNRVRMLNIWYSMTTEPHVPNAGALTTTDDITTDSIRICVDACDPSLVDTTRLRWVHFFSGSPTDSIPIHLTHNLPMCISLPKPPDGTIVCYALETKGFPKHESPTDCFTVTDVAENPPSHPIEYSLGQNYPNPFNPTTNFVFEIPEAGSVRLSVFDLLGREVARVVDENLPPGSYTRTWNSGGVSTGVYFYRLTAGRFSDVKKLLIVK